MISSYIIRLKHNKFSNDLATESYIAAKALGYNVSYFEGIYDHKQIADLFLQDRLVVHSDEQMKQSWGTRGCFASHYTLWKTCVETNEPIIVMEHDGYPIRNPEKLIDEVEHACHLDYHIPFNSADGDESEKHFDYYDRVVREQYESGVEPYPKNNFYGQQSVTGSFFRHAYGYILKPKGAKRLIDFVYKNGVFQADQCFCENAINIQRSKCTYVRLNPIFKSIKNQRDFTTRL